MNNANGSVPIIVLTTDTFGAANIDVSANSFAGAGVSSWKLEDVDDDGELDLLMHFRVENTNLVDIYRSLLEED